jgi:hypothetical protein
MKTPSMLIAATALCLLASPAFAVDTTKVYNSGILVLLFLGVCALIVLVQVMPALVMMFGAIKGLVRNALRGSPAPAGARK